MYEKRIDGEKMRKFSRIVGLLVCIIFIPILLVNTVLIVKSCINPNKIPDFLGYKPFIVLSGSMEPEIMTGDIAIIKECQTNKLKVGDIIAFRSGDAVITHRIIEIAKEKNETVFYTKGDNNNVEDKYPVYVDEVEGVFKYRIPQLGNFAMFVQTTVGTITVVLIPFILLTIYDINQRKKETKLQLEKQKKLEKELEELRKQTEKVEIK